MLADVICEWTPKFGRDGRNHSSPSRYPCFYAPNNPEVVVARFDLARTQYIFLMFFVVPASLLVVSCGVLLLCSRHGEPLLLTHSQTADSCILAQKLAKRLR